MIVAHGCEGTGVHGAVAEKFIDGAVVVVGAGAGDDVDLAAPGTSHVSGVAAGDHLELHHRVGRWAEVLGVERGVGVGRAVQKEEVGVVASASDDHGRALPRAPIERVGLAALRAEADVSTGDGEYKVDQHAAVEGQFLDRLGFDDLTDAGVGGAQDVARSADLDTFLHRSDLEGDVDGQLLTDFQTNRLVHRGKAGSTGGQFIFVGQKRGSRERSPVVGRDFASGSGAESFEEHRGFGHRERLRVPDGAGNQRVVALAECRRGEAEKTKNEHRCSHCDCPFEETGKCRAALGVSERELC